MDDLSFSMTSAMMAETAFFAQNQSSFDKAQDMIAKTMDMQISEETIRQIAEGIGDKLQKESQAAAEYALEHMDDVINFNAHEKKVNKTLYIMIDGSAVNTRIEDKDGSTWREDKLVIAFSDRDMIKRKDGSRIIVRKECDSLIGTAEDFKGRVLNTALRAGYGQYVNTVVISDGAKWIRNLCEEVFPNATLILDLFHLKENVYDYAKHLFNYNEKKYKPWAAMMCNLLEQGKVDKALSHTPIDSIPANTVNLRNYIESNRDRIDYPTYKECGYFVGSGAVESANKVIVQQRCKQAGMRWSVKGADAVIMLRCKVESGRWGEVVEACA